MNSHFILLVIHLYFLAVHPNNSKRKGLKLYLGRHKHLIHHIKTIKIMETNNTLTVGNLMEDPIIETEDTSLSLWGGIKLALLFFGVQILVMIPVSVIALMLFGTEDPEMYNNVTSGFNLTLGFAIGAWVLYRKRGLMETAFHWNNKFVPLTIIGLFLSLGVSYIVGELMTYTPGYEAILEFYLSIFESLHPLVLLLGGVLIGPICEEIIFRGIILEGFLTKYTTKKAIIFSALIFGIIHFIPIQVVNAFFMGIVLGWIYIKTKSLWVCIGIHVINNAIAFFAGDSAIESTRTMIGNDALYIASFAIAAIIAYVAYRGFQKVNEPIIIEEKIQA